MLVKILRALKIQVALQLVSEVEVEPSSYCQEISPAVLSYADGPSFSDYLGCGRSSWQASDNIASGIHKRNEQARSAGLRQRMAGLAVVVVVRAGSRLSVTTLLHSHVFRYLA